MTGLDLERNGDRLKSVLGVAIGHALLGYAFLTGLTLDTARPVVEALNVFDVPMERVPPPVEEVKPLKERTPEPEGAAAPPNIKSVASPVVAPKPKIEIPVPSPVVAAPTPATGPDRTLGAAPVPGPGTGRGGEGTGTGSGRGGDGTGGGGGVARHAQLLRGNLSNRDYPRRVKMAGIGGRVRVRIDIGTNGRVAACTVTESSGNFELDDTSCRLIVQRYRYRPAEDAQGRPVPDISHEAHVWWTTRGGYSPPPPPPPGPGWEQR